MGKDVEETRAQVERGESDIADAYAEAMEWLRGQHSLDELVRAVKEHRLDAILVTADLRDAAAQLADAVNATYTKTATETAAQLSRMLDSAIAFDTPSNHWATHRISTNSMRLVRDIEDDQRAAIRTALTQTTEIGMNPNAAARFIRGSIGLAPSQVDAVANYRQALRDGSARALDYELRDRRSDGLVEDAVDGERELTEQQIDSMTSRYQDRLLGYRSRVIARTESLRAVHQGDADMWSLAMASGDVEAKAVRRTWRTAHDKRVRPSHRAMDTQERGPGEPFTTGDGVALMYPCDPDAPESETVSCRCVVVTRIRR